MKKTQFEFYSVPCNSEYLLPLSCQTPERKKQLAKKTKKFLSVMQKIEEEKKKNALVLSKTKRK